MKNLILAFLFIGLATFAYGQYVPKGKTAKAEAALNQGKLNEAKAEIDEAFRVDDKGKVTSSGKNWYLKAKIYNALYLDESDEYGDLVGEEALTTAMDAYNKVLSMEKESSLYAVFANQEIAQLYAELVNKGAERYNENEFEAAYAEFMKALKVTPNDTTALLYGGVSAQQADMMDEALWCFETLINTGNANMDTYKTVIFLYRTEKEDMDKVLEMVGKALEKFPTDNTLIQEKITTLIIMERVDEAKKELETAISQDPTNAQYYYFLGYLYDFQEDFENAETNYVKAVELDSEYYDANYNLAVIYYNKARKVIHELNELSLDDWSKQEAAYAERALIHFKESLPFFEKALELSKEDDLQLLETIQGVYYRVNMKEKGDALTPRIKALSGI